MKTHGYLSIVILTVITVPAVSWWNVAYVAMPALWLWHMIH